MRLPDNEIHDITKLLEEGKPPPDKYRSLLFNEIERSNSSGMASQEM